ncbi:hypothetical protein L249_8850 [Ophiocordyceps polyrhachis-furcata BCC 54312]|uniref:Uncharacterized protein n=1 Tax=Ophiocordyceps polyrhachis-furcata BCC 54312 TaxID=1330021 RepID=A0A367L1U1_9HYPO|nr:hypothetical protein L249_8850 [Ophiocordyceps polyrhachis-furcata BCC 54312]
MHPMTTAATSPYPGPPPQLRRHKVLPRPRNDQMLDDAPPLSIPAHFDDSPAPNPHVPERGLRRIGPGPDPPPTPPDHSRNSSQGHSAVPLSPSVHDSSLPNMFAARRPVATPPDQPSLPTPDLTPPGPVARSRTLRPSALDRGVSRVTGSDSLTGSFKTAREVPSLSDDESGSFAAASHDAAPRPIDPSQSIQSRHLLDLALNHIDRACGEPPVSCARKPIAAPDANVSSTTQVEHQEYHHSDSSPKRSPRRDRGTRAPPASSSTTPIHAEPRRLPGHSSRPSLSAVVGAILIAGPPQRRRTLRHVRKRGTLREPDKASLALANEAAAKMTDASAFDLPERQVDARLADDDTSSVASGRIRRQVWKEGGIPVVVVPDRRSSSQTRPKGEPASLRSSSSRSSRKTASSEESRGRGRSSTRGQSAGAEAHLCTRDGSPAQAAALCPSLSASTTTPNDKSQNARATEACQPWPGGGTAAVSSPSKPVATTEMDRPSPTSIRFEKEESQDLLDLGRHEDAASAKKYSSRNTPFSIASFETAPEVSEAMAVHMYPHQNSSLLVVDHLAKSPESTLQGTEADQTPDVPKIRTTCPNGGPVTPPGKASSDSDEADSPLRNPRPPPPPPPKQPPPAINLIPATPSGCTPAHEKAAREGNYFEATGDMPTSHPSSLVRRALGRRRKSMESPSPGTLKPLGLLARSLSLSRQARHGQAPRAALAVNPDAVPVSLGEDAIPAEEDKLHPYWRPHPVHDDDDRCRGGNRSGSPRRTLSARMRRTFAILPLGEDERRHSGEVPERRTIRRSPSGSLRVMRRPASVDTMLRVEPWSAPGAGSLRRLWRSRSLRPRGSKGGRGGGGGGGGGSRSSSSRSEGMSKLPRMLSERQRAKRTQELRQMISGPKDVRDGVREVIEPKLPRRRQLRAEEPSGLI